MKRTLLLIAMISLLVLPSFGQKWDTINGAGATCVVGKCVYLDLPANTASVSVVITGTFSATLQFEVSADNGANWTSASPASTTQAGTFTFSVAAKNKFAVRASAFTSGAAKVSIVTSTVAISGDSLPDPESDGACLVTSSGAWVRGACSGSASTGAWGSISGTLASQTDLKNALDLKLNATDLTAVNVVAKFGSGSCSGYLKSDGTCGTPSTGTVTHTGGALTANSLMAGAGSDDAKVLASDPTNCSAGQAPTGIDKTGAAKGCFTPSGALPSGVASDGLEGLAVTGKVAAASVETTGSAAYVLIPDGGTAGANKFTSAGGAVKWGLLPVAQTIASGTATLGTDSIAAGQCATAVTVAASGVATTDVISWTPNADISGVTGYATAGTLRIYPYPTANNVNFKVCNGSASDAVTPGAVTLNWRVTR